MLNHCDFLVVGGGIAGASAAWELASQGRVILLEREHQPGYHATGRSAAIFLETYGNALIRGLTCGSRGFFEHPPADFTTEALIRPRGALFVATEAALPALRAHFSAVSGLVRSVEWIDGEGLSRLLPCLPGQTWVAGVYEPDAQDLDVHAIHHGYLRALKRRGGAVVVDAALLEARYGSGAWRVRTAAGEFEAPVLVNAAGAWADEVAALAGVRPVGLTALRRTAIVLDAPADAGEWPYFGDIEESFYVKPEAGRLLASPCDETPMRPCDVQPDDYEIALIADRIGRLTTLPVARLRNKWAGLRTFSPDRSPVVGWAPDMTGFFWLAGQGGYGIQTAPAMARCCAGLIAGERIPPDLVTLGVSREALAVARFHVAPPIGLCA